MTGAAPRLLEGDCVQVMAGLPAGSVDLVFADPPYNLSGKGLRWEGNQTGGDWFMVDCDWDRWSDEDYLTFTRSWVEQARRLLSPRGSIWVCCTCHNLGEVLVTLKGAGFKVNNVVTWYKSNAMPNMTRRVFTHACEYLVWAVAGPGWTFEYAAMKRLNPERRKDGSEKQMRDMWTLPLCQGRERLRAPGEGRALHPTQKPEALVERAVLACSRPGGLVLDPFLGTGTTAVVALRHGRRFVGVERDPVYLAGARDRVAAELTRLPG